MADSGTSKHARKSAQPKPKPMSKRNGGAEDSFERRIEQARKARIWPSFMESTNGGGCLESVQGFDIDRAMSAGFRPGRLSDEAFIREVPRNASIQDLPRLLASGINGRPERVIDADDRVRVIATARIPWRCVCHLAVRFDNGSVSQGTGWFAGPRTVITAGHVLKDRNIPGSPTHIQVNPGRNGNDVPFGFHVAHGYELSSGWRKRFDPKADYAAIFLDGSPPVGIRPTPDGGRLGYFGFKDFSDAEAAMMLVNNVGYPADKELGTQWFNGGRIADVTPKFLTYLIDTEVGQSGSPIFHYDKANRQRLVMAVHTRGFHPNHGVRITGDVFDQILDWVAKPLGVR